MSDTTQKRRTCLVGMTMGARKRRARFWACHFEYHINVCDTKRMVLTFFREAGVHRYPSYARIRTNYFYGQRLRPCLGCSGCMPGFLAGGESACDGYGVVPAGPRRVSP